MSGLVRLVLLAILALGLLPTYRYSRTWGYSPPH